MPDATTIKASASRDTLRLEPALGAGWRLALAFVYAEDGDGVSAGDPVDVSGYTWRLDFKRDRADSTDPLFSLVQGDGIDATNAASGVLVLTGSADNLAGLRTIVKGDLVGTKSGDVWPALPIELRVGPLATRAFDDGQVDDLGAGEVAVSGPEPVTVSVTQVTGSIVIGGGSSDPGVSLVSEDDTTITLDITAALIADEDDTTITLDL